MVRLLLLLFMACQVAVFAQSETVPVEHSDSQTQQPVIAPGKTEFIYPDFSQCYEKNSKSIVYFGKTRAVAIDEHRAIAYSKERPTVAFVKYDYLSHLYLFETPKKLTPIKLKPTSELKPGEWLGSMTENSLIVVNVSKKSNTIYGLFEHSGRGEVNSIIGGLCCEMMGLGIGDKYFIGSEGLQKFLSSKEASYEALGARLEENNESILVSYVDVNNKHTKLKEGDKILALNGKKVKTLLDVQSALNASLKSQKLSGQIQRDKGWIEENILAIAPKIIKKVPVKKIGYAETKGFKLDNNLKLSSVPRGSFAEQSGLKMGDRLIQIDDTKIDKIADADFYLEKSHEKENNLLFERDNFQFFITLKR
ncbi:MAG: PDZ domain-containing protein [Sulfurospirillaceae bacterium]|nr:PDZ domain-containing protein [Sulfurospirillaceae bacterium]